MDSPSDSFLDFADLGPELVLSTAELAGFTVGQRFQQLNSLENRVFTLNREIGAQTSQNRNQLVIKFYRPGRWSLAQILEEHQFLLELQADDFPVCAPLALEEAVRAGDSPTVGQSGKYFFAVWEMAVGRIPDEFNDDMFVAFGGLLGRLHEIGARRPATARQPLNADTFIRAPIDFLKRGGFLPLELRDRYFGMALDAAEALDRALATMPSHRIHGDCHWGNLLATGNQLRFLDFDDFMVGPAVQDLWMIAPAADELGLRQRELVLQGYQRVRPFDRTWLTAIPALRAARYIYFAAWIARRIKDEYFQRTFPQFGSAEYWETETKDLEQLVRQEFAPEFLEEKAIEPAEDYSKLTNKDYFYDL